MTKEEAQQIALMLHSQGFTVEWFDTVAETFLVRLIPTRGK